MRTWKRGHTHRGKLTRGLLFGVVSGIGSAHSLLLAKSAVELLVQSVINKNNQFNRYETWLILLGLVVLALTQLYFLHQGLKLCSTSVLYPLVFCIYNIIAILDGLIYFQQASRLSPLQIGLTALGTIILLIGVAFLSWRLTPEPAVVAIVRDDAATMTTMYTGNNIDEDASESDGLLLAQNDEEAGALPSTGLRPSLTTSTLASTTSAIQARPWTRKQLGAIERNEIWGELGDYDVDEVDIDGREYLISVAYNDAEDDEESISDESLTVTTSSSSGGANTNTSIFGRVQNMIRSRLS